MSTRALFVFDRDNWCSVFAGVADADVGADEYLVLDQDGRVRVRRGVVVRARGLCQTCSAWVPHAIRTSRRSPSI